MVKVAGRLARGLRRLSFLMLEHHCHFASGDAPSLRRATERVARFCDKARPVQRWYGFAADIVICSGIRTTRGVIGIADLDDDG